MLKILVRGETPDAELVWREANAADVSATVAEIIADVRANGDAALLKYNARFDRAEGVALEVTPEEMDAAYASVDPELVKVMQLAAENIREFHKRQLSGGYVMSGKNGALLGQRVIPLRRVGLYIPGGTAAYPSSVLMNCIPAKIAGVDEIVMTTPASGGAVSPVILAAAKIAGVDRVFRVGGAQAVAALAYGTETVPQVDKIVGPGNAFVAEAKRQVFGQVAIDMIAGPSEILIVSDGKSDPKWMAADLLSQAEHDRLATAILITDSMELARAVQAEVERQLAVLPREEIARAAIEANGKIIVTGSIAEAVEMANAVAPEHLELAVDEPFAWLGMVRNAGSIFLGRYCPEPLGDYLSGTNHTLPTMGTARFSSPLGVEDFVKRSYFSYYTPEALESVADAAALFADAEGLHGHAVSATARRNGGEAG